mmetsp:Transcript_61126/g.89669  ORF Transcript_61126/g.89669 Transcript_61126/m.89669 type:complete len:206 (-) Transcript_61126:163-780(-)
MARADTFCSHRPGNRMCAWQVRKQVQVFGHESRPDAQSALRLAILHHSRGSHLAWPGTCTACPSCLRVLCTCMRVPCLRLCVCQLACVGRYRVPARACSACAGSLCSNVLHLFAHAFAVLSLHLVDTLNCSHDHWEGTPPLNHGLAASTFAIGARQRLLWLTSFSSLTFVCTAETLHLPHHPHITLTYKHPQPHTHTLHTACQRT